MKNSIRYKFGVIGCFIFMFILSPVYADNSLPAPVARVIWVKGELKAVMPNKEERLLQRSSVVYLKDILITDNKSTAQIAFTDGTLMSFEPDTKFSLDQYSYSPKNKKGSAGKFIMNLATGGFRTITGAIAKDNPQHYAINTSVATIGVRGTNYRVISKNGELYIGYTEGKPCIKGKKDKAEICLDKKNKYVKVGLNEMATILEQRPDVFDQDLEITPAKIGLFDNGNNNSAQKKSGPASSFCIS